MRIFILIATASLCAWAQTDSLRVSLHAAMDAARKTGTQGQLAESRVREAQARIDEAKSALLPTFGATASDVIRSYNYAAMLPPSMLKGMHLQSNLIELNHVQDARLNARITLLNFAAWKRFATAKTSSTVAQIEYEAVTDGVAFLAGDAWLNLAKSRALIQSQQNRLQIAMRIDSITNQQIAAGSATQFDLIRSQGLVVAARAAIDLAAGTEQTAEINLQRALGLSMGSHLVLADSLAIPTGMEPEGQVDSLVAHALLERPEIQTAERRIQVAENEASALSAENYPTLDLAADYGASAYQFGSNEFTKTIALQATWSIWDGGRRSSRKVQQSEKIKQATLQLQDARYSIEQEVRTSHAQMLISVKMLATARERSSLAHEELELAQQRFQSGMSGLLDVINAQNNQSLVDDSVIDAIYRYNQAHLYFLKATHHLDTL